MKYWNKKQKGVEVKSRANTLKRVFQNKTENWKQEEQLQKERDLNNSLKIILKQKLVSKKKF